jgi:hypothetical protein
MKKLMVIFFLVAVLFMSCNVWDSAWFPGCPEFTSIRGAVDWFFTNMYIDPTLATPKGLDTGTKISVNGEVFILTIDSDKNILVDGILYTED